MNNGCDELPVHRTAMPPVIWLACVLLTFSVTSHGADGASDTSKPRSCIGADSLRWRGATMRLENDLFTGTDHNYTNGVAFALISEDIQGKPSPGCLPPGPRLLAGFLQRVDPGFWSDGEDTEVARNLVVRFGQSMYTPEDETRTDLIADDRPYAGLLYLGLSWNRCFRPADGHREVLDTRELTVGVIGPWSLAEQSQDFIHRARGFDRFQGWEHQLGNEPAFQLAAERKYRQASDGAIQPGWGHDLITSHALRLGTIETSVSTGLEWRAGWNLPNDFGSYPIRPGAENRPPSTAGARDSRQMGSGTGPAPGVHAFLNLEAKAVARDFSLDGNLFRSSHSVTRRPWVAQAAAGISAQWLTARRGFRLALMRVWRTREFDEQVGHHAFGSVALNVEF